jgi:AcrR family transcriptional regulator
MGRPRKYDDEHIFRAALRVLKQGGVGALSVTQVCDEAGVPSGVVYHRFPSKGALLAGLWLDTVERFQAEIIPTMASATMVEAALFVVRWAREHRAEASLLMVHHREDFLTGPSAQQRRRARRIRAELDAALAAAAKRLLPDASDALERTVFGVVRIPRAALEPYLRREADVPQGVDVLVADAVRGISVDRGSFEGGRAEERCR